MWEWEAYQQVIIHSSREKRILIVNYGQDFSYIRESFQQL